MPDLADRLALNSRSLEHLILGYMLELASIQNIFRCVGQFNGVLEGFLRPTLVAIATKNWDSTANKEITVMSMTKGLDRHCVRERT